MNNKILKILLVIDIIAIIILLIKYFDWNNKKNISNNNNQIVDKQKKEYEFKKFTFSIPNDIKYSVIDEFNFKLKSENYEAIVEIILNHEINMLTYPELYYEDLHKRNINVDPAKDLTMNNRKLIIYNKHGDSGINSILCYFRYNQDFDYEVEIFNDDNSFNTKNLSEIMNILLDAKYDYKSTKKYNYYMWDFVEELNEKNNKN